MIWPRALLTTVLVAMLLGAALPASAATYPPGFSEQVMVSGLTRPTQVAWAPDGRMFIAQKDGLLRVVAPGSSTAVPIRDFSPRVNGQDDRGLLGMAVDAGFASNQYLYLLFTYDIGTPAETPGEMVSQLLRVRVNALNQVFADTPILGTETGGPCPEPDNTIDCIPSEGFTHSIGTVRAAADGTLWVSNGDGISPGAPAPPLRAYDERSMAGKILHIDRNGNGLPGHPLCPGEPLDFVCTKVHAAGFRNPFRFSLRPAGGLVVGDVGSNNREEIDLVGAGGRSFGWPCYEGSITTPEYQSHPDCQTEYAKGPSAHASPVYSYPHAGSNAVVAGPTYTGARYPAGYRNSIFFGDFTGGFIRRLVPTGSGFSAQHFAAGWRGVALESAPNGDLVTVDPGDFQTGQGRVSRLVYTPPPSAPPVQPEAPGPRPHRRPRRAAPARHQDQAASRAHQRNGLRSQRSPQREGGGAPADSRRRLRMVASGKAPPQHPAQALRPPTLDASPPSPPRGEGALECPPTGQAAARRVPRAGTRGRSQGQCGAAAAGPGDGGAGKEARASTPKRLTPAVV